ncbi:MAG: hypothetical protein ACOYLQ_10090 [Hyphomicrobiaceae bacterium]
MLVLIWFGLCALAFYGLYSSLFSKFQNPEGLATALGAIAWPFVVFVVALPVTLVLSSHIRELLSLKKTIDDAPKNLLQALESAEKIRTNLEESGGRITNDINGALGEIEARMTGFEGRVQRLLPDQAAAVAAQQPLSARERLASHLDRASGRFYEVLEEWNADGRRRGRQLVVTRGGGNRRELVETLRERSAFSPEVDQNDRIARYLSMTFSKQLSARRGGVEMADVEELDGLQREAEAAGAAFE